MGWIEILTIRNSTITGTIRRITRIIIRRINISIITRT
jgi:hypothetical protein